MSSNQDGIHHGPTLSLASFLAETYTAYESGQLNPSTSLIVFGNEAADLDSVISALILAWSERHRRPSWLRPIPIVNCLRDDRRLRPDMNLILIEADLQPDYLLFVDDLGDAFLNQAWGLILVDHNRLAIGQRYLAPRVRALYDHHRDDGDLLEADPRRISQTASAVTVVINDGVDGIVLEPGAPIADPTLAVLVLAVLLADSANDCPTLARLTDADRRLLERVASVTAGVDRASLYGRIVAARAEVGGLSVAELLRRDLKVVERGAIRVAVPVVPVPVWAALGPARHPGWYGQVQDMCARDRLAFIVIVSAFDGGRQIGLVASEAGDGPVLADDFRHQCLESSTTSAAMLGLELVIADDKDQTVLLQDDDRRLIVYRQQHLQYTRKAILPLVQDWLLSKQ